MGAQLGLPDALRARGLTVEVVPGWETRSAGSFNPKGAVCHWTAGPRGSTGRPSLNVVINGRPGLPGPLCNVYGDRNGVAVVVAAGRANHAGTGGWRGLVGNSAVFGTEMEAAGPDDFTATQRWAYPRINAAYADLADFGADMVCGHSEWAGPRKSDVNGYTMDDMRAQVRALLNGENEEFTVAQFDDLMKAISDNHQSMAKLNYEVLAQVQKALAAENDNHASMAHVMYVLAGQILTAIATEGPTELTAEAIAAAIPADLAKQVADNLVERLAA